MSTRSHIVVVDDERDVRETVAEYLAIQGFRVTGCDGGPSLRRLVDGGAEIDLILLDITMPGEDGLSLARWLRGIGEVPILMLTAMDTTVDRIVGLEMGADDYVGKPFDLRELLARIRTILRRSARRAPVPAAENGPDRVAFGTCRLDLAAHRLIDAEGTEIKLTAMEFDLLQAFARNPNRVLSRDRLLDLAHNKDAEPFDRSIDIRIARLRKKIEPDPAHPTVLKTVRGAGYMFVPDGGSDGTA